MKSLKTGRKFRPKWPLKTGRGLASSARPRPKPNSSKQNAGEDSTRVFQCCSRKCVECRIWLNTISLLRVSRRAWRHSCSKLHNDIVWSLMWYNSFDYKYYLRIFWKYPYLTARLMERRPVMNESRNKVARENEYKCQILWFLCWDPGTIGWTCERRYFGRCFCRRWKTPIPFMSRRHDTHWMLTIVTMKTCGAVQLSVLGSGIYVCTFEGKQCNEENIHTITENNHEH